jgi:hypothetical protein
VQWGNNPVRYRDPDGRNPVVVVGGVVLTAADLLLIGAGVITTGIIIHQTQSGGIAVNSNIREMFGFGSTSTSGSQTSNATASNKEGLNHQRNNDRKAKEGLDQNQANTAKDIDKNITGKMPDGNPAPKRDPNDGGNKTKIAIGVAAIGAGAAAVESIIEGTQPQEIESQQPPKQPEVKPQEPQQNNSWWQNFLNLFQ